MGVMKAMYLSRLKFLAYSLLGKALCFAVRAYQVCLSPFMVNSCRYYPSCSAYCRDSIHSFGPVKGCFLTLKRLAKCHPFSRGGYDPVPESVED